jgi:hypothetical protein
MSWRPGDRCSIPSRGKRFLLNFCAQTGSGAHPASCTMGTGGYFPRNKARPGRDADHSPHLAPKSLMSRSYTSSPPCPFIGVLWDCFAIIFCLIKMYEIILGRQSSVLEKVRCNGVSGTRKVDKHYSKLYRICQGWPQCG